MIWINLIDLLGRFAHDAGHGARVSRLRTLAAGRSGPDLDRNRYGALARPFRLLSHPRGVGTMCRRASSFDIGASKLFALQPLIHVNASTHLKGQKKTHVAYCVPTPSQSERRGRAVLGTAPRLTGAVATRHWTRVKWKVCSNRLLISPGFLPRKVSIRFENQSMSRDFRSAMAYSGYEPVDR